MVIISKNSYLKLKFELAALPFPPNEKDTPRFVLPQNKGNALKEVFLIINSISIVIGSIWLECRY